MLQPTPRLPSGLTQLAPDSQATPILPHSQMHSHTSNLDQYAQSVYQTRPLYPSYFILSEPFPTTRPTLSTSPLFCPDCSVHIRHRTNKKTQLKNTNSIKTQAASPTQTHQYCRNVCQQEMPTKTPGNKS